MAFRANPFSPLLLTALMVLGGGALPAQLLTSVVSCPLAGVAGTDLYRGFYVTDYRGTNLAKVTLAYGTNTPGRFQVSLTAHRNTYDGPRIGTSQTATFDLGAGETRVTFDFAGAPVSPGDTIAFTQTGSQLSSLNNSYGSLYFDAGTASCAGIFETQGTAAPLDAVLRQGMGVTIEQVNPQAIGPACVASDTVLCLDDIAGDRRFAVSATYHTAQSGGLSGQANAMPLAQLGAIHGGVLWFFGQDNPEILVKMVNGCALNQRYWVFLSATTNVGYTVTVDDTFLTNSKSYSNVDLTPASPVEDTAALDSCHACTGNDQCRAGFLCCFIPAGRMACLTPTAAGTCPLYP